MRHQRAVERLSFPPVPIEMLNLQSASEYACAKMLEKYTRWQGIEGATCQIKVGRTTFDFRIHDTFVEYHPISLRREFLTDGMRHISSAMNRLPKENKIEILKAVAAELEAQYAKRRSQVLSAHPLYAEMPLICVHTPEEFIRKVVCRFMINKSGNIERMKQEFNEFRKDAIALHQR